MAEQRWFAGLPVVRDRQLEAQEEERLRDLTAAVRNEGLVSILKVLVSAGLVLAASVIDMASGWLGLLELRG